MSAPVTHPARLRTLAAAHGVGSFDLGRFRYLELACGEATNLLPLAARFPECTFVGSDRPDVLAHTARLVLRSGLRNVELVAPESLEGTFDYVIAEGAFRDLPVGNRREFLRVLGGLLAPDGLALVCYEVLPGAAARMALQRALSRSARPGMSLGERLHAAGVRLSQLARRGKAVQPDHAPLLVSEFRRAAMSLERDPGAILAVPTAPIRVADFIDLARGAGLEYVCESVLSTPDGKLDADATAALLAEGLTRTEIEEFIDVASNRRERASILSRGGLLVRHEPDRSALRTNGFYATSAERVSEIALGPGELMGFETGRGARIDTEEPLLKAALLVLSEAWPRGLLIEELHEEARVMLRLVGHDVDRFGTETARDALLDDLNVLAARGGLEVHAWSPDIPSELDYRPKLTPVARLEFERGGPITGARHEPVELEPLLVALAIALDGETSLPDLRTSFGGRIDAREFDLEPLPREAAAREHALNVLLLGGMTRLRRHGLLEAPTNAPTESAHE